MFAKFSVKKPLTIFVGVVIILLFGIVSLTKMTPDLFPSVDMPYVMVVSTYPGASPEEAEQEITKPLEQQLATLANLENINSVSGNNYSMIQMQFTDGVDMNSVTVDISEKINQIKGTLPEQASQPVIMKVNMDMMPTVISGVEMGDKSEAEISKLVEDELMTPLEGVEGVATVNAMGLVDSCIQVVLSQERIDDVNKKLASAIKGEFNKGTDKVKDGLGKAKNAQKQLKEGKKQLKSGRQDAAEQFGSTRKQLKNSRSELLNARKNLNDLKKQYEISKNDPAKRQQIEAQISMIISALNMDLKPDQVDQAVTQIDAQVSSINDALETINSKELETTFQLGTQYADLSSAESSLGITINQLNTTLADLESQKKAAVKNADLSGVLTMDNVSAILSAQNFSMPAGYVSEGDCKILVSVGDKIADKEELGNLILLDPAVKGVAPVRLRDIATITYGGDGSQTYTKVNGKNGVCLTFTKQSTYATATVSKNINNEFEKLSEEHKGLSFVKLYDGGEYINTVIMSILQNLLLGALLAMLILFLFLRDIRPTLITAISIPLSVLFAIVMMYFSAVSINMVSLAGLAIGVGMLVDNSIVVIENIFRMRSLGYSRIQSAVSGAVQVSGAIIASTLTTVCVFIPIIFISGTTRDIFQDLALTVAFSLLASLIIALTVVPAMAKSILKGDGAKSLLRQDGTVIRRYQKAAGWALNHKAVTLTLALVMLVSSCGLALIRGFEFMPSMQTPQVTATIKMPEGSKLTDTSAACDDMAEKISEIDGVTDCGQMLSSSSLSAMGMSDVGTDVTQVSMYILVDENKLDNVPKIAKLLKSYEKKYNCKIETSADMDMTALMGGSDISITLYGEDTDKLRNTASSIESLLNDTKGIEDVSDIDENSSRELHIVVDKNKAMKKGLTVAQIFQQVNTKLTEKKDATKLSENDSSIDVVVENTTKDSFTKDDLRKLKLDVTNQSTADKKKVKLTDIASIQNDASLDEINHTNQKRSVTVTASVSTGYNVTKMTNKIQKTIKDNRIIPSGVELDNGGQNEEIIKAMKQMMLLMLVGFILIYLVMVAQFQSLRSPFIIIFTVPLAFTGGMLALLVTGKVVSVISMMGFVMLMGIIVNNGIVLVDCINRFRLEGMDMDEAILKAGAVRLRPVLMTAMTTVLGLVPLAIGFGTGAEMMSPIAIVCIGGLIYATLTTLVVVPVMYKIFGRKNMVKIEEEELEIISA